eukprot:g15975.t1
MMMSGNGDGGPTGLKGKLASLEDFISMQNEELAAQRQEIESLRNDKAGVEEHYQGQEAFYSTKGRESTLATADHATERGEDLFAAATPRTAAKAPRGGRAGGLRLKLQ